jgi:hypothetical protein
MHVGSFVQIAALQGFYKVGPTTDFKHMFKITVPCECKDIFFTVFKLYKVNLYGKVLLKTSAFVNTAVGGLKLLILSNHEIGIRFLAD